MLRRSCSGSDQYKGAVHTNWPSSVGRRGSLEKTGASVVRPAGLQKPLVVKSPRGHLPPRSCAGVDESVATGFSCKGFN